MDEQTRNWGRQTSQDFRDEIRDKGERLTRSGRNAAIREFDRFGSALHKAAENLHEQHDDYFAGIADSLADRVDSVSHYIQNHEPREILGAVQDFSKRNPYLTAGGMFVAGLAISRFFKAGTTENPHQTEEPYGRKA